jgi:hypothetical protein
MRAAILYMSMSLDGFVGSDREHPGVAATPFPSGIVVHVYRPQHT